MTEEELHLQAAAYADKREKAYLDYVKKGSAKKLSKEMIGWVYRDAMQEKNHGH